MKASVIVPARNEGRFIADCISSLRAMDVGPETFEIVVVDNGSTDDTAEVARRLGIVVSDKPDGRVGAVRNHGASLGAAEVMAFIDGDCVAQRHWLSAALRRLKDPSVGIVGGGYVPNPNGTWVERSWAPEKPPQEEREVDSLPGGSMILRREVFDAVGGFSEQLSAGEDDHLCQKIKDLGLRVIAIPECYVVHLGYPPRLATIATRQVWHGTYQIDVAPSAVDVQLLMTHSFLVGTLLFVGGIGVLRAPLILTGMGLVALPLGSLAVRKSRGRKDPIVNFLRMLPIAAFFYFGRAIGLLRNYRRLAFGRLRLGGGNEA